jgi:hypothetical protein
MPIEKNLLTIFVISDRLPVWQRKQRSTSVVSRRKLLIITLNYCPKLYKAAIFMVQVGALVMGNWAFLKGERGIKRSFRILL